MFRFLQGKYIRIVLQIKQKITGVEALTFDTDANPKTNAKREEETKIEEIKQNKKK